MGNGGTTHHATEDIAILRSMANMTVIVPADTIETGKAVRAGESYKGPMYIRIGRSLEPLAYADDKYDFEVGKSIVMRDCGTDLTVIACGICVKSAMDAADMLKAEGIGIRVINMHTIKPLDTGAVLRAARETGGIITAEEHSIVGGLGGAVAETLADAGIGIRFKRVGVPDCYSAIGYPEDLYPRYGMDAAGIRNAVLEVLNKK
jgi:transketolase